MKTNRTRGTVGAALGLVCALGTWACSTTGFTGVPLLDATFVQMTDQLTFSPDTVTVQVDGTVTWANADTTVQTVTADPSLVQDSADVQLPDSAAAFHSDSIPPRGSFSHKFTVAGTYEYVSVPDESQGMRGWVIVQ